MFHEFFNNTSLNWSIFIPVSAVSAVPDAADIPEYVDLDTAEGQVWDQAGGQVWVWAGGRTGGQAGGLAGGPFGSQAGVKLDSRKGLDIFVRGIQLCLVWRVNTFLKI